MMEQDGENKDAAMDLLSQFINEGAVFQDSDNTFYVKVGDETKQFTPKKGKWDNGQTHIYWTEQSISFSPFWIHR